MAGCNLISSFRMTQKNIWIFPVVAFSFFLSVCTRAEDLKPLVEDSGSKEVDALVLKLISQRPAPFPNSYWGPEIDLTLIPYETPEVSNAIVKLKAMGPKIFPALITHLRDDRYSFSDISAAWLNFTVGDAIVEVLSDGHYMYSGYKFRHTPSGGNVYLSFKDYIETKGPEKWAEWAKDKTKGDIQMDFIDWCVTKEKERGFTDAAQEKRLMQTYERAREQVGLEYFNKNGLTNTSPVIHPNTNKMMEPGPLH
jgi:hypothetical protein